MLAALKQGQVRRLLTGGNAVVWPERYRQVGYYYEVEKDVYKLKPKGRALTHTLEQMFRDEVLPPVGEKKEWVEIETWPKFVQDFEGDFTVECYVAMFLMFRNHLGRVWEAAGSSWMRYKEECRRVKQILLVITPNTMVYLSRSSKAFQYLGPKVGYSANLCDAEYPYHFYCEPREQADVLYARMGWLEVEGKTAEAKEEVEKAEKRRNPYRFEPDVLLTGIREWDKRLRVP